MDLFIQLVAAALLAVATALVHGVGVIGISGILGLDGDRPRFRRFHVRNAATLGTIALMLFLLHMIEIALFGSFYLAIDVAGTVEEGFYLSASAYSTLGTPTPVFPPQWRLLGAIEGVVGFLMLGWSTAFFVTDMNKMLRA